MHMCARVCVFECVYSCILCKQRRDSCMSLDGWLVKVRDERGHFDLGLCVEEAKGLLFITGSGCDEM